LVVAGSVGDGSTAAGSTAVGSTAAGSTAAGSTAGSTAAGSTAVGRGAAAFVDPMDELRGRILEVASVMLQRYPADQAYAAQVAATLDGSVGRWQEAVARWRVDGQRYQLAVALFGLATAAAGAGDRAAAAEAIQEVAAVAGALGALPLSAEADTLARRIGLRSPGLRSSGQPTPAGIELLTAREREVLRLVAEGQSNSRIAERLYISPKTASVHVSRIIAKLEVANRVEAAAVAHRLGLLEE
jgi:DNA-binding CsgD family transcriptional regulator